MAENNAPSPEEPKSPERLPKFVRTSDPLKDRAAIERILVQVSPAAVEVESTPSEAQSREALLLRDQEQDIDFKRQMMKFALWSTSLLLAAATVFVGWYLYRTRDHIDPAVMIAWMSATIVETLGIVAIIARYLFPGTSPDKD